MKVSNQSLLFLGAVASGLLQVSCAVGSSNLCARIEDCSSKCLRTSSLPGDLFNSGACPSASDLGAVKASGSLEAPVITINDKAISCEKISESGATDITRSFLCQYTSVTLPECLNKDTVSGKGKKNGRLNDCCKTTQDCLGDCKDGKCGEKPDTCNNEDTVSGKGKKNGILNDCCKTTQDCLGDCKDGKCGEKPTTCKNKNTVYGKCKNNGILNDCCKTTQDCYGECKNGKCGNKPTPTEKCTNKSYFGKSNGKGPFGVCCRNQWDCKEDCKSGVCTK
ncbi:hypothetical protein BD408DRAFT_486818 [Parasitella parasitica]|nr:hypothetical protein BD408DRAFT_486818 [Parasitella parasitica]